MRAARWNAGLILLSWVVSACVPVALIGTAVRLILLPAYPRMEYATSGFPADPYGFGTEDRLRWADHVWNYLVTATDSNYLADLEFEDGSPVFGAREVSHMADVKAVVGATISAWLVSLTLILSTGFGLWRLGQTDLFRSAVRRGGWLTIGLAALIGTLVGAGVLLDPNVFWEFFTVFHGIFFAGDSWLFAYSDTLIRLFPIRFWQDTFLIAAFLVLGGGLALAWGMRERRRADGRGNA